MKNAEPLNKAPKEGENQAKDKAKRKARKLIRRWRSSAILRKRSKAHTAKPAMATIATRSISRQGDGEYSIRTRAPANARAQRYNSRRGLRCFLSTALDLGCIVRNLSEK